MANSMVASISPTAGSPISYLLLKHPPPLPGAFCFICKSAGREHLRSISSKYFVITMLSALIVVRLRPETLARLSVGKCHGLGSGLFRIRACNPAVHGILGTTEEVAPTYRATPGQSSSYMRWSELRRRPSSYCVCPSVLCGLPGTGCVGRDPCDMFTSEEWPYALLPVTSPVDNM